MPCDARKTPYLVEKHGDGKKNVSEPGISIIKCISMTKKTLLGDPNFVSGDLFTGASRHKATWEKIQLGALTSAGYLKSRIYCYNSDAIVVQRSSFTSL